MQITEHTRNSFFSEEVEQLMFLRRFLLWILWSKGYLTCKYTEAADVHENVFSEEQLFTNDIQPEDEATLMAPEV